MPGQSPQNPLRWLAAAVGWAAYLLALALALPFIGVVAWATVFLPVVAMGYGWGRRVGVLGAVAATVVGNVLYRVLYDGSPGPSSEALFATFLQVVVGYGAGWAGETRRRLVRVTADLREQTRRLEEAQATAHIGSWSYEVGGAIVWSRELQRLFGVDRTPTDFQDILRLVPPEDHAVLEGFNQRLSVGGEAEAEHRVLLPGGGVRWLHVRGRGLRGPDGSVVRLGGTSQDVTARRAAEEALERSLAQLEEAQAIGHIGSWHWEPGGAGSGRNMASAETRRIFGVDTRTLGDLSEFMDLVHPDDREYVRGATQAAFDAAGEFDMSYRVVRPDGAVRWVRSRGRAERGPGGGPGSLRGTVQDVTEEEESRRALASKEAQLTEAQALSHVGSWELDLGSGEGAWSDEAYRILGLRPGEVEPSLGAFLERIHPEDLARVRGHVADVEAARSVDYECRVVRPDGGVRHVFIRIDVVRDGDLPTRIVGAVQDITERVRAAQALAAQESLLRGILDSQEGGFFALEPARGERPVRVLVASRAVEEIFGDGDLLADGPEAFLERIHPDDRERVRSETREAFEGTGRAVVEFRIVRADAEHWLRVSLTPVLQDGVLGRVDGHVLDVTAEKERDRERRLAARHRAEARRLREMDRMKVTFLNTAAHELATPLTPLRLQLALLAEEHPGHAGLAMMGRNVERLQVLVHDLLDASRLQAGRLQAHLVPTDLDTVLGDAVRAGEMQARLMQVVNNLLQNAFKFTPAGGSVSLKARQRGGHAVVEVHDTGLGLTRAQLRELFKPFNQFHRDVVGVHAGTGLGLYISRGIMERHGGTLTAASDGPGRGATFTVRVPLA